ncbi:hypothetical protein [Streptomyces sp. KHY 26]|uniref:hypothetical protein n=1 Tax=Streptomyces sp. KHY 26 TaxID=3097359 RepID=UPI00376EEC29
MNHSPVEERLRAALSARADAVGPADLRPLRPPTAAPRTHRLPTRGTLAALLALAAVAALVFLTVHGTRTRPAEPARSPAPTVDAPSPHAGSATPTPLPTAVPSSPAPGPR